MILILAIKIMFLDPLERVVPTRKVPVIGPHDVIITRACVCVCSVRGGNGCSMVKVVGWLLKEPLAEKDDGSRGC